MRYLIFNTEKEYTDEYGDPCSLDAHLIYLALYGGTPDSWFNTDDLMEAINEAKKQHFDTIIVDEEHGYETIYQFKKKESNATTKT